MADVPGISGFQARGGGRVGTALLTLPIAAVPALEGACGCRASNGLCDSEIIGSRLRGEQPVVSQIQTAAAEKGASNI